MAKKRPRKKKIAPPSASTDPFKGKSVMELQALLFQLDRKIGLLTSVRQAGERTLNVREAAEQTIKLKNEARAAAEEKEAAKKKKGGRRGTAAK